MRGNSHMVLLFSVHSAFMDLKSDHIIRKTHGAPRGPCPLIGAALPRGLYLGWIILNIMKEIMKLKL